MQDKVKLMVYLYGNGDLNIQRVSFPIDLFNPIYHMMKCLNTYLGHLPLQYIYWVCPY